MLWQCTKCTTAYSVGAPKCPECGYSEYVEAGDFMPKITSDGVATDRTDPDKTVAEQLAEAQGVDVNEISTNLDEEKKEGSESAGNNSSKSEKSLEKNTNSSDSSPQKPVLETENPSKAGRPVSFTVGSTDTSGKESGTKK